MAKYESTTGNFVDQLKLHPDVLIHIVTIDIQLMGKHWPHWLLTLNVITPEDAVVLEFCYRQLRDYQNGTQDIPEPLKLL